MGWTRFLLLGDIGQQLDLQDQEARLKRLSLAKATAARRDVEQDERIAQLEAEVLQLSAGMAALVNVLRDKRVAADDEIAQALELATRGAEKTLAQKQERQRESAAVAAKAAAARKLERVRQRR